MDSKDQVLGGQSNTEQPEAGNSDEGGSQSQTFEVNGQTLTAEKLLENYTKLQAEYTKARQEVSETKKNAELSEEDKAALEFIKQQGFVTRDDLEQQAKKQNQEIAFNEILSANPGLRQFEQAIKTIGYSTNESYEDIIDKYGFMSKAKLVKARNQGDIKGMPETKEKSISDMSLEEYEKYRTKIGIGGNRGTFS